MKNTPFRSVASVLITLGAPGLLLAQTTWDFGATPDQNWSSFNNWDTNLSPAGTAVIFGATGVTANATTVGNVVDSNYTGVDALASLTYNGNSANWQVTQIANGQTLTVGAFTAGGLNGNATTAITKVALTGAGSLIVNGGSNTFLVSNTNSAGSGGLAAATLDMSNLASFSATVGAFNYSTGTNGVGTVYLADSSTITATTLSGGGSGNFSSFNSGITNKLFLGTATTLNVDTIVLAQGRTRGTVSFRPADSGAANTSAVSSPTLTIRGSSGGSSRASLTIGTVNEGGSWSPGAGYVSTADFSAGSVDAMVSTLLVGNAGRGLGGTGSYTGKMVMAGGTFDATSVIIGQQGGNTGDGTATATMNGWLQIAGGDFTAGSMLLANSTGNVNNALAAVLDVSGTANMHVTGDITLAKRTNSSSANVIGATVNISGGQLKIDGNLVEGTSANANALSSTVNLSGGVLDMTRGNVAVDTFNFTGGVLKNVASFAGNLNAQNAASLGFDGVDGSFSAMALAGSLTLGGSTNLGLTLANDFTPVGGFTIIANDGSDSITGTFATINGGAFGSGNSFSLTNNLGTFDFVLNYAGGDGNDLVATLSMVPEPSAWGQVAGLATFGFIAVRRRPGRR